MRSTTAASAASATQRRETNVTREMVQRETLHGDRGWLAVIVLDVMSKKPRAGSSTGSDKSKWHGLTVDDLPLGEINEVYLLDFIGSSGFIGELYPKVESVIILDHHKTAVEALCGNASFGKNVIKVIDMDKSGATIAFDFFKEKLLKRSDTLKGLGIHNHQEAGKKNLSGYKFERVQKLFEYIKDGDIWRSDIWRW
ncbi:hypothetical protein ZIOFF_056973 [Zingiber officinale]|uniref:Uncharacterized protein n=1 Tax=Zingiber officinale TaxID=94328 RepID=A0A8J5FHA2_ZINOF|nr:hypothetical protein ZIOFF_056973 [Zingiber officinale]